MIEFLGLSIREWVAVIFLAIGLLFAALAAFGVMRLPDFYTRLHASGMGETLGLMCSFIGLMVYEGFNLTTVKLVIVFLLVFLANPIGTHILVKSAYQSGLKPWTLEDEKEEEEHAESHS